MWKYINKNPRGRSVGDCTVRAISTATNSGWIISIHAPRVGRGDSEFLKAVDGRKADKVWKLVDELVEAVKILHPRMYTTFIDKVQDL